MNKSKNKFDNSANKLKEISSNIEKLIIIFIEKINTQK